MNAGVERRLAKLEADRVRLETPRLAEQIQAVRLRMCELPEEVLEAERRVDLEEMRQRHAVRPLHGLELRMMQGLERVCAAGTLAATAR